MEKEFYSNGHTAIVYRTDRGQRILYPRADLFRVEGSEDAKWFAKLFYTHKIASLLFPDNFINVVGAQLDPANSGSYKLFSEIASVPNGHAAYSSHMELGDEKTGGSKRHMCEKCSAHRNFHHLRSLESKAWDFYNTVRLIGIDVPPDDPSDYCIAKDGNLLFFEVSIEDPQLLEAYLSSLKSPMRKHLHALLLLQRFNKLNDAKLNAPKFAKDDKINSI